MNESNANIKISGAGADAASLERTLRDGLRPVVPDGVCERIVADARRAAVDVNECFVREYHGASSGGAAAWSSMLAACAVSFCVGMFCMYRMLMPLIDRPATVVVGQPARMEYPGAYPYRAMGPAERREPRSREYRDPTGFSPESPIGLPVTLRAGKWTLDDPAPGW